jgi:FtsZ-binding cell division protein ZapB
MKNFILLKKNSTRRRFLKYEELFILLLTLLPFGLIIHSIEWIIIKGRIMKKSIVLGLLVVLNSLGMDINQRNCDVILGRIVQNSINIKNILSKLLCKNFAGSRPFMLEQLKELSQDVYLRRIEFDTQLQCSPQESAIHRLTCQFDWGLAKVETAKTPIEDQPTTRVLEVASRAATQVSADGSLNRAEVARLTRELSLVAMLEAATYRANNLAHMLQLDQPRLARTASCIESVIGELNALLKEGAGHLEPSPAFRDLEFAHTAVLGELERLHTQNEQLQTENQGLKQATEGRERLEMEKAQLQEENRRLQEEIRRKTVEATDRIFGLNSLRRQLAGEKRIKDVLLREIRRKHLDVGPLYKLVRRYGKALDF